MQFDDIYALVDADLAKVKQILLGVNGQEYPWLSEQLEYLFRAFGKGIRPAVTLLAGKFYDYNLEYLLPMAVSVELMHTATLVHDDAIDNSEVRRGQATINRLWGNDIAILLGDYLFARAGEFVADTCTPRVIKLFSHTLAVISSGEINQYQSAFNADQTREEYFRRIFRKTASLFSLATEAGAVLSRAPEEGVTALREFSENMGIAFQVVDDILDFIGNEQILGKPVGSDLSQGTLTLPAIMFLERSPKDNPVRKLFDTRDVSLVPEVIAAVRDTTIIDECYQVAGEYSEAAKEYIARLPKCVAGEAFTMLADYLLRRED
ncbi:polyprenyl synthetase family protein [Chloroflexota bacterium]